MSGAPREAYAPRKFIIISLTAVKLLGSWEAAGCFQRIAYKAERDGYWRATMKEVAAEIEVSERTAHRITKKLREVGWLTAERENTWESTLTWTPIFDAEDANVAVPEDEDETAGQSTDGQDDSPGTANVAASGTPELAASEDANLAAAQDANLAPSLFSETAKTSEETSVDQSPDVSPDQPDGASSTPAIGLAARQDVERLCEHLATRIAENTGDPAPTITQKWRDAARLMMDKDHRTERQGHNMIEWCQSDEFWRSNIMSMPTLRAQYSRMKLQIEGDSERGATVHRLPDTDEESIRRRARFGGGS